MWVLIFSALYNLFGLVESRPLRAMKLLYSLFVVSSHLLQLMLASPLANIEVPGILGADLARPSSSRTIYLIRHAEKPSDEADHGLSIEGERRTLCIRELFGTDSDYNIGFITALAPEGNEHTRHKKTVQPLAKSLGLLVDTTCISAGKDPQYLYRVTDEYFRSSNDDKAVLISWKHSQLPMVTRALGASTSPEVWEERYDLIWTIRNGTFISETHQHCPGLDNIQTSSDDLKLETPSLEHLCYKFSDRIRPLSYVFYNRFDALPTSTSWARRPFYMLL